VARFHDTEGNLYGEAGKKIAVTHPDFSIRKQVILLNMQSLL
jgi:hypothetical protein